MSKAHTLKEYSSCITKWTNIFKNYQKLPKYHRIIFLNPASPTIKSIRFLLRSRKCKSISLKLTLKSINLCTPWLRKGPSVRKQNLTSTIESHIASSLLLLWMKEGAQILQDGFGNWDLEKEFFSANPWTSKVSINIYNPLDKQSQL